MHLDTNEILAREKILSAYFGHQVNIFKQLNGSYTANICVTSIRPEDLSEPSDIAKKFDRTQFLMISNRSAISKAIKRVRAIIFSQMTGCEFDSVMGFRE